MDLGPVKEGDLCIRVVAGLATSGSSVLEMSRSRAAQYSECPGRRGRSLTRDGVVAGARLVFEHAARRGCFGAMAAVAQSYDPQHLSKLGIQGIQPDIEKAISWYERASRSGDRKSRVRAEALTALAQH